MDSLYPCVVRSVDLSNWLSIKRVGFRRFCLRPSPDRVAGRFSFAGPTVLTLTRASMLAVFWLVVAFALLLRVVVHAESGFTIDDSWITFRYAENLVAGHGLVYNIGERVQGSTSPLQIFLVAAFLFAGFDAKTGALILSLLAAAGFLIVAYRLMKSVAGEDVSPLFVLPLAAAPGITVISVSGMETMLFVFLQCCAFLAYVERRPALLGVIVALLLLTRIDGALVVLAIVATDLALRLPIGAGLGTGQATNRLGEPWPLRDIVRSAGIALLLVAPWIAFATWYYGDPVPNSIWAKRALYSIAGMDRTPALATLEMALRIGYFLPLYLGAFLAVAGLLFVALRRDRIACIAVWFVAYLLFLILGRTHVHPWYLTPFHAFALLSVCMMAAACFYRRAERRTATGVPVPRTVGAVAVLFLLCLWGVWTSRSLADGWQGKLESAHAAVGQYLKQASAVGDVIYAPDIGYVGALTGRRILDSVGIVSAEVIPFNKRGDFAGVLRHWQPKWAVIGLYGTWQGPLLTDDWILSNYRPVYTNNPDRVAAWPSAADLRELRYDWEYLVLERVEPQDG